MAIKRGEDGRIIDEPTLKKQTNEGVTRRLDGKMPPLPSKGVGQPTNASGDVDKTVRFSGEKTELEKEIKKNVRTVSDDVTRVVRPRKNETEDKKNQIEQVVGWIVVIDGPGKGASREVGYGNNAIGRSGAADIALDFGDESISREKHCILTYDQKGRNFFLSPGESRNLAYLNETPLLAPKEISTGDKVSLGETVFSFVSFCGEDFDWEGSD